MRLFLALNLPDDVRVRLADAAEPLRAAAPHVSWADAARVHLTLKFLGEQPETMVEPLRRMLADVAGRHRVLELAIGEVGAFPNFHRPRVVWMGVGATPKLELLHHDIEAGCESLGFEVEGRPFRPHLTLGRVNERTPQAELKALSAAAGAIDYRESTFAESVDLMESLLSNVARYRVVALAPLAED